MMETYTDIDSIVRNVLLQRSLPMHFYVRLLSFALDALKELEMDLVPKIKSVELTVDGFSRVKLPCDYVDWVRIGTGNGQYLSNMGVNRTYNRLRNHDANGLQIPYGQAGTTVPYLYPHIDGHYGNGWHEQLGGLFGVGTGTQADEFMVLPEHDCIQLSVKYAAGEKITLDYVWFDRASAEAKVHKYAEAAVQAFAEWKYVSHLPRANHYDKQAAERNWDNQVRILSARMNDLNAEQIARISDRRRRPSVRGL